MAKDNSISNAKDELKALMKELILNDIVEENAALRNELIKDIKKKTDNWLEEFDEKYTKLHDEINKPILDELRNTIQQSISTKLFWIIFFQLAIIILLLVSK